MRFEDRPLRVVFVNRFFYPDHSATSQMLTDLAFGLAEKGLDITVVTSRLRYDDPAASLASRETVGGVRIKRIWTSRFGRTVLALRAVDYLTFYLSVAWTLLKTLRRGDVVVAMTDPPVVSIVVAGVASLRRARMVNWLQDLFPEIAEAMGMGGKVSRALLAPLRRLRNASLRAAEMNVVIGALMADRLQKRGVEAERITVVPNWADCEAIRPVAHENNRLRADWNLTGKFVIGYSGNLGRAHDIETLLSALSATATPSAAIQSIRWVFIGGGAGFQRLRRETKMLGFTSVSFHPYQPREALAESLSVADVHIVSLKREFEGLIVPSKFYGIAAAGRATIFVGSPQGEISRLVAEYDCGASVAIGDALALVETLNEFVRDGEHCRLLGRRARQMCEDRFSKTRAVAHWFDVIGRVASGAAAVHGEAANRPFVTPRIENRREA